MTTEEHNKAVGICHLAYGGVSALMMLAILFFIGTIFRLIPEGGPPISLIMLMLLFMLAWTVILTMPSFIAGYAVLKHKSWARTASIVAAVVEMLSFPFGTAVAFYSFWFMFSDEGRAMYDKTYTSPQRPYALRDTPPPPNASEWGARVNQVREREYVPPTQPPDWRNE
jgi:hypothetical protein